MGFWTLGKAVGTLDFGACFLGKSTWAFLQKRLGGLVRQALPDHVHRSGWTVRTCEQYARIPGLILAPVPGRDSQSAAGGGRKRLPPVPKREKKSCPSGDLHPRQFSDQLLSCHSTQQRRRLMSQWVIAGRTTAHSPWYSRVGQQCQHVLLF